jgi:hypothetical protein
MFRAALTWSTALLVWGCSDGNGDGGSSAPACVGICADVAGCPKGFSACVNGRCLVCAKDSHCDLNTFKGGCRGSVCAQCKDDSHCSVQGFDIGSGKCDGKGMCNACASDVDCGYTGSPGKLCGAGGYCVACRADTDCGGGKCESDVCTQPCKTTGDCGAGLQCDVETGECRCVDDKSCQDALGDGNNLKWVCE